MSPRERRTIAIGLGVMGLAFAGLRLVPRVWASARDLQGRAAAERTALVRARDALRLEPVVRESLGVRAQRLVAAAPRLFGGATPSEAAAELASLVTGLAATHRVRIARQDARPDSTVSVFTRLTLRLEAEGDAQGIAGWIASLEEGAKLIEVRSLVLSAVDPAAPAAQPERLRAEVVIVGWAAVRHTRRR
jgi:hypothetical protein